MACQSVDLLQQPEKILELPPTFKPNCAESQALALTMRSLQVKGVKTLAKSLQALVAADALEGNNQYSCENCGCKQDADRQFCVRTLPPCLRINLQRFVFDWQSLQKQKVRFQ